MSVIEVSQLHHRYGRHVAVEDVSFTVDDGEIFGIVGPNGAGKTTTVECLAGLRQPTGGRLRVLGHDPHTTPGPVREQLGVQLQSGRLPDRLRVGEAMALYAACYRHPADPQALLRELSLDGQVDRAYRQLSGGQQQRLSIALALVGNPRVVILDELTTGLDPNARRATWRLIQRVRARGITVLLVSHFMDEVEQLCDRAVVIDRGRVIATGTPAELIDKAGAGSHTLDDAFLALAGRSIDELES